MAGGMTSMTGSGGLTSPWLLGGLELGGGLLGSMFGGGQSQYSGWGNSLLQNGINGIGTSMYNDQNMYGQVNPYWQQQFGQNQQAIKGLEDYYSNPQAYMNNFRTTTMGAQGIVPGANQAIGGVASNYLDSANRGLFTGSSGSTPSQLTGANNYITQGLNTNAANTYANIGQMQSQLPLQFQQQLANITGQNAGNLFGMSQGLNQHMGQLGQQQANMGMGLIGMGNQQNQQNFQNMSGGLGGALGGIGSMLGMQNAMKMMRNQGQGGGGNQDMSQNAGMGSIMGLLQMLPPQVAYALMAQLGGQ